MPTFEVIIKDDINKLYEDLSHIDNQEIFALANDFESHNWRYDKFIEYLLNNMYRGALSKEEQEALIDQENFHSIQSQSAKNLRIDDTGGEIGEILLHGIIAEYYNALSVVPKIFYKQSANLYANGADSVHIVLEDDDFSLWSGEAKFYDTLTNGFRIALESVKNLLSDTGKLRKEFQLLLNYKDLELQLIEKEHIYKEIRKLLNPNTSLDDIIGKIHIPILILHQCEISANNTEKNQDYFQKIREEYNSKINKKAKKLYDEFQEFDMVQFHIIVFPVPNKKIIVDTFNKKISSIRS